MSISEKKLYARTRARVYACMRVCVYACMHTCMHVCMLVCTYIYFTNKIFLHPLGACLLVHSHVMEVLIKNERLSGDFKRTVTCWCIH